MNTRPPCEDWTIIKKFLPPDWERAGYELGGLRRKRKIKDAETLLRVLLMHAAAGTSLRTTVAYAREAGLCEISDVGLQHRLKVAGRWLGWIAQGLCEAMREGTPERRLGSRFRVRLVDGTLVNEAGATGSDWHIHYSILLHTLQCDSFLVTDVKQGESLRLYTVEPDDVLVADRGYCRRTDIAHVRDHGGQVVIRFQWSNLPLYDRRGNRLDMLPALRGLRPDQVGDWDVWIRHPRTKQLMKGRLCALRKSAASIDRAQKKARHRANRNGQVIKPETIEHASYVTVFTTISRHWLSGADVLALYRDRWQIELVFKRLKSLVRISVLPKTDEQSCKAWLHAKLVIALLAERLYREAESFSPWGYPI